ncbi:hypothetical protein BCR37DRAFT_377177 [Protomyces lactucae-debilis]|uniref:Uncharacterized protein n=1 Tax=Protomyces lactucae-debilis TaxID=2754530 RepID=A0A1Y2FND6_PROLT|nr:uncharacterized protein BCR37DRAFT_377177 [Protomyces lactucae-debilis]ORY85501.1 hypothetical protein BCR37DRAFT_377177 [Protomyces lactucae-debilis]
MTTSGLWLPSSDFPFPGIRHTSGVCSLTTQRCARRLTRSASHLSRRMALIGMTSSSWRSLPSRTPARLR